MERTHTSILITHLEVLEKKKKEQKVSTPKRSRQEIIKLRVEIDELKTMNTVEGINETKSWTLEKRNERGKPLFKLKERYYSK